MKSATLLVFAGVFAGGGLRAASAPSAAEALAILPAPPPAPDPAPSLPPALNPERIFGVIPNFQTVNDSAAGVAPLTKKQKWNLAWKETIDPFNVANAFVGAAFSQAGNETPNYGMGSAAFSRRFGAALADLSTQNFFSAGVVATILHQDPRYFRMGPRAGILKRVGYSVSRLAIARQDSGRSSFNASNFIGMGMGIVASNAYYPASNRTGTVMMARLSTSLTGGVIGNLMSEFWPDLQPHLPHFRKQHR